MVNTSKTNLKPVIQVATRLTRVLTLIAIVIAALTLNVSAMTRTEAGEQFQNVIDHTQAPQGKAIYRRAKAAVVNGNELSASDRRVLEADLPHFDAKVPPVAEAIRLVLGTENPVHETHRRLTGNVTSTSTLATASALDLSVPAMTATQSQVRMAIAIIDRQVAKEGLAGGIMPASESEKDKEGVVMLVAAAKAGAASLRNETVVGEPFDLAPVLLSSAARAEDDARTNKVPGVCKKALQVAAAYKVAAASLANVLTVTEDKPKSAGMKTASTGSLDPAPANAERRPAGSVK